MVGEEPSTRRRTQELRLDVGLASPIGEIGVSAQRWLFDTLALDLGVGYGYSGAQTSLMAKLAFGSLRQTFTLGVGPSLSWRVPVHPGETNLSWVNGELGYQHPVSEDWFFAASAGVAMGVAGKWKTACTPFLDNCQPQDIAGHPFPSIRVGVGRSF